MLSRRCGFSSTEYFQSKSNVEITRSMVEDQYWLFSTVLEHRSCRQSFGRVWWLDRGHLALVATIATSKRSSWLRLAHECALTWLKSSSTLRREASLRPAAWWWMHGLGSQARWLIATRRWVLKLSNRCGDWRDISTHAQMNVVAYYLLCGDNA